MKLPTQVVLGLAIAPTLSAQLFFQDATDFAGVGFAPKSWIVTENPMTNWMAASVSAVDYDGDGWDDLFVFAGDAQPMLLFRNQGDSTFSETHEAAGLIAMGPHSQSVWGDADDDGDLDVLILSHGDVLEGGTLGGPGYGMPISSMILVSSPTSLKYAAGSYITPYFENQGDGTFVERSQEVGLRSAGRTGGAFGDLDGDLDLDLFTVSWGGDNANLFLNDGTGVFRERTPDNMHSAKKRGFNAHIVDYDEDGDYDIMQVSDFAGSVIWRNEGGWTFSQHDEGALGVATDENGMGACVSDYDNDGDFDWFVSSIYADIQHPAPTGNSGNRLYQNQGNGTFLDVTDEAGVRDGGWGWGSVFADFDNDGHEDIAHTNGWMWELYYDDLLRVFHSNGDGTFEEVAVASNLYDEGQGRGLAMLDFNQDGRIDLACNNRDDGLGLWRNSTPDAGAWMHIGLQGTTSNSYGVGAVVRVRKSGADRSGTTGFPIQTRLIEAASHYQSQSPPLAWFGLGSLQLVRILIEWPSGLTEIHDAVPVNQRITFVEGTGTPL